MPNRKRIELLSEQEIMVAKEIQQTVLNKVLKEECGGSRYSGNKGLRVVQMACHFKPNETGQIIGMTNEIADELNIIYSNEIDKTQFIKIFTPEESGNDFEYIIGVYEKMETDQLELLVQRIAKTLFKDESRARILEICICSVVFTALFILVKLHSFELCKDYMSYAVMSMEMYLERYKGG